MFGLLPLYVATNVYVPSSVGVALTGPYVPSPLTVFGDPLTVSPEALQLPGPCTVQEIDPPAGARSGRGVDRAARAKTVRSPAAWPYRSASRCR